MSDEALSGIGDLRDWLRVVSDLGQLRDVKGAHWNLEVGTVSEANYRRPSPPALLFDDIEDYRPGQRVLTASMANAARLGITLRFGTSLTDHELVERLRGAPARWLAEAPKYDPVEVASGPLYENVVTGDDIDLLAYPVPFWHAKDGGRFIGTGCAVFTSDPDTGALNAGAYRMQVQHGGRSASINIEQGKHGMVHVREWFAREGRAPVTVSLGHDPVLLVVAGTEVPAGVSELNYAGAIAGRPQEVVIGEVTGLPMPAASELCVEGWLYPDRKEPEGPFGEWTGYYSGGVEPVLTMEIERVYARNDPILLGAPPGKPPHDYSYMRSVMKSAMIHDALADTGLQGLAGVWSHEAGGGRQFLAVAIEQGYAGHARQAGHLTAQLPAASYMNKFVVVVDADVDVRSLTEVVWAMCTRCDPVRDIDTLRYTFGSRVDPLRQGGPTYNTRAVIDACRPYERLDDFPTVAEADPQLLRAAVAKWPDVFGDWQP